MDDNPAKKEEKRTLRLNGPWIHPLSTRQVDAALATSGRVRRDLALVRSQLCRGVQLFPRLEVNLQTGRKKLIFSSTVCK